MIGGLPTEGKILDKNKCLCAVCGKKDKFGSTIAPSPERKTILVLCEQCTINESAKQDVCNATSNAGNVH